MKENHELNPPDKCTECGKILTVEELEDNFKLNKGTVCHDCILRFMKRKRLVGEIVSAILVFVSIISFYVGNYIFGIFFALLMLFIFLDTRSVNNYITDLETRGNPDDSGPDISESSENDIPPENLK